MRSEFDDHRLAPCREDVSLLLHLSMRFQQRNRVRPKPPNEMPLTVQDETTLNDCAMAH